jgi:hypothetical protein
VALEKRTIHIADIAADPEYSYLSSVAGTGVRSILGVPLFQDGEVIGVIALLRKAVNPFTERQIDLVQTFADQAVIAIDEVGSAFRPSSASGAAGERRGAGDDHRLRLWDMANIRTAMTAAFDFLTKPIDFPDLQTTRATRMSSSPSSRGSRESSAEAASSVFAVEFDGDQSASPKNAARIAVDRMVTQRPSPEGAPLPHKVRLRDSKGGIA